MNGALKNGNPNWKENLLPHFNGDLDLTRLHVTFFRKIAYDYPTTHRTHFRTALR